MTNKVKAQLVTTGTEDAPTKIVWIKTNCTLAQVIATGFLSANLLPEDVGQLSIYELAAVYTTDQGIVLLQVSSPDSKVWSLNLTPGLLTSTVTLTAAQVLAAYATPASLIAAPGAGLILVPRSTTLLTNVSTVFAAGGVGIVQYGAAIHGAGTNALAATIPAAEITASASQIYSLNGNTGNALTTLTNTGLYFSNQTQAFTGGAGSTLTFEINYNILFGTV